MREHRRLVATVGLCVLLAVIVLNAWVSDDAYITFRTVDNFVHGYGLRWNVDQRVESYTHPLWMFVVAAAYLFTREPYFTSIAISIALSMAAAFVLASRVATGTRAAALALLTLTFSKAFVDYSTSGLENPLTHFLLAIFFAVYFSEPHTRTRAAILGALCALVMLNRLDAGLLVLPAFAAVLWDERAWSSAVAALVPLAAWEAFSIVYYGFPFPNTAYAKLSTGILARELIPHGVAYLQDSLARDPLTLTGIAAAVVSSFSLHRRHTRAVVVGIAAYLAYVVWIGGDFMSGRFFAAPLFCAAVVLARFDEALTTRSAALASAAVVLLGFVASPPTIVSGRATRVVVPPSGTTDERLYYLQTNLLHTILDRSWRPVPARNADLVDLKRHRPTTIVAAAGFAGFGAGPGVHVIDVYALADPLLARLPAKPGWRIGHYERDLPNGYYGTIESGVNHIADPETASLYDALWRVTSGPIWTVERWRAIVALNIGRRPAASDRTLSPLPTVIADFSVTPDPCSISGSSATVDCVVDGGASDSVGPIVSFAWAYLDVREPNNMRMPLRLTCANTGTDRFSQIAVTLTVTDDAGTTRSVTKDVRVVKIGACGF